MPVDFPVDRLKAQRAHPDRVGARIAQSDPGLTMPVDSPGFPLQTAADLSCARVYISILGSEPKQQQLTLQAIQHAAGFIQGRLAQVLTTRTCPSLSFFLDDSFKKGMEVSRLLEEIKSQIEPEEEMISEVPPKLPSGDRE